MIRRPEDDIQRAVFRLSRGEDRLTMPRVPPNLALSRQGSPQGLRPEIAQIIEALARDAVKREDRRAREAALKRARGPEGK
jgi:hypothetical protein